MRFPYRNTVTKRGLRPSSTRSFPCNGPAVAFDESSSAIAGTMPLVTRAGWSFWAALPVTVALMVLVGMITERFVLRPLVNQNENTLLMATIGLAFVVEGAAQLDGYSWWQVFFKVLLPMVKPGIVAAALLCFIFCWNSFTFVLQLGGANTQTSRIALLI